jgi:hypothetical protein
VVHSARAALDTVIWRLIVNNTGRELSGSKFPIVDEVKPNTGKAITAATKGLTREQRAVVERAQPHHWGEKARGHPLAVLQRLSNRDKHRVLRPAWTSSSVVYTWEGRDRELVSPDFPPPGIQIPLRGPMPQPTSVQDCVIVKAQFGMADDPAEVARYFVHVTGPDPQMEVYPGASLQIVWGEDRPLVSTIGLAEILLFVRQTVHALW